MANADVPAEFHDEGAVRIFDFLDYHAYLASWVAERKRLSPSFSFQWLANRCGFKSRSFLRLVCLGERDLSEAYALQLAKAMGLSNTEREYFLHLVALDGAETPEQRELHHQRLARLAPPAPPRILSSAEFDLFRHWWTIPLWEAASSDLWKGDWAKLGSCLEPPITAAQAEEGVANLVSQGFLELVAGRYHRREANLHTREQLRSAMIRKYQFETLDLARRALERIASDERQITTLALGLDERGMADVLDRLKAFRADVVAIAARTGHSDRMMQLNIQFFPTARLRSEAHPQHGSHIGGHVLGEEPHHHSR